MERGLLESPQKIEAVERVLSPSFMGTSLRPAESRLVRSDPCLQYIEFAMRHSLSRELFFRNCAPR